MAEPRILLYEKENLAWLAGFFEGEGTVKKAGNSYYTAVTQVFKEPLERCHKLFPFGKIFGPYNNGKRGNRQPYYCWSIGRFEYVQALVAAIWPWLSRRRKDQCKIQQLLALENFKKSKFYAKHGKVWGS